MNQWLPDRVRCLKSQSVRQRCADLHFLECECGVEGPPQELNSELKAARTPFEVERCVRSAVLGGRRASRLALGSWPGQTERTALSQTQEQRELPHGRPWRRTPSTPSPSLRPVYPLPLTPERSERDLPAALAEGRGALGGGLQSAWGGAGAVRH